GVATPREPGAGGPGAAGAAGREGGFGAAAAGAAAASSSRGRTGGLTRTLVETGRGPGGAWRGRLDLEPEDGEALAPRRGLFAEVTRGKTRTARLRAEGASARSRRSFSGGGSAARERVGEFEGRSPSDLSRPLGGGGWE